MFMGQPYLPDQTKPPRNVYNTPLCRGNKNQVHVYLYRRGYRGNTPLLWHFFMVTWEIGRGGFRTNTRLVSPRSGRYLFSRSPNETNRRALSEMHYSRAYRRALQCIMFNFYSEYCCDMGPFFAEETKPSVYTQNAVRDDPEYKITDFSFSFTPMIRGAVFSRKTLNRRAGMLEMFQIHGCKLKVPYYTQFRILIFHPGLYRSSD